MASAIEERVVSNHPLTSQDFEVLAAARAAVPVRARKIGFVAAVQASARQQVDTHWNGRETTNVAEPGDWIATNLTVARQPLRDRDGRLNRYVIAAARFAELYEPTGETGELGSVFKARAVVAVLPLAKGFDIVAPWGERQTAPCGYLICNGDEVYGNNAETFEATYEVLPD